MQHGFVRLRPELWAISEVRQLVSRLWTDFKRKMASHGGLNGR